MGKGNTGYKFYYSTFKERQPHAGLFYLDNTKSKGWCVMAVIKGDVTGEYCSTWLDDVMQPCTRAQLKRAKHAYKLLRLSGELQHVP